MRGGLSPPFAGFQRNRCPMSSTTPPWKSVLSFLWSWLLPVLGLPVIPVFVLDSWRFPSGKPSIHADDPAWMDGPEARPKTVEGNPQPAKAPVTAPNSVPPRGRQPKIIVVHEQY